MIIDKIVNEAICIAATEYIDATSIACGFQVRSGFVLPLLLDRNSFADASRTTAIHKELLNFLDNLASFGNLQRRDEVMPHARMRWLR